MPLFDPCIDPVCRLLLLLVLVVPDIVLFVPLVLAIPHLIPFVPHPVLIGAM